MSEKPIDQKLTDIEKEIRGIFDSTMIGIYRTRIEDGKFIYANQAYAELMGYQTVAQLVKNFVASEHYKNPESREELLRQLKLFGKVDRFETEMTRIDGSVVQIEVNAKADFGKGYLEGFVIDITERKLAEYNLRENEEKYRLLFELESDVIILIRHDDGRILEVNAAGQNLYGYTREELLNMKNTDLSAEPEKTREATREERTKIPIRLHRKKDGTVFPVEISGRRLNWKGQNARIATIRDISARIDSEKEKARLETQLQSAQKMEALGTLAGGIAHDFNNILSPILMHTEMAMMDISRENPIQHSLKEIYKAGERARDLVKQILTFSRQREHERTNIKMGLVIKEVLNLIRSTLPATIKIDQKLNTESDIVYADPTQIHQVIMNLCTNAAHAMREKGGVLDVSLADENIGSDMISEFRDLAPGSYVKLTVSDTGHGMKPEVMERIFEPYFTTKEQDKGTGLGLAVVHGIVKSLGGEITVESQPGKRTIFQVWLKKIELEASPAIAHKIAIPNGTERILFVDDEKGIVDIVKQMLERLGYKITTRTSSVEALEAFRNKPDAFDLIITDMTMPNMTGAELAERIIKIRPDISVILCTGFSEQINESNAKKMGLAAFVMKPINIQEIAQTIRKVLDKK